MQQKIFATNKKLLYLKIFQYEADFREIPQKVRKFALKPKYLEIHQLFVDGKNFFVASGRTKALVLIIKIIILRKKFFLQIFHKNNNLLNRLKFLINEKSKF